MVAGPTPRFPQGLERVGVPLVGVDQDAPKPRRVDVLGEQAVMLGSEECRAFGRLEFGQ